LPIQRLPLGIGKGIDPGPGNERIVPAAALKQIIARSTANPVGAVTPVRLDACRGGNEIKRIITAAGGDVEALEVLEAGSPAGVIITDAAVEAAIAVGGEREVLGLA